MISLKEACDILGPDVLRPQEFAAALRVRHRDHSEYVHELNTVPYTPETLRIHRGTSILFPGYPCTLVDLQRRFPHEFCFKKGSPGERYLREYFARRTCTLPGWHLFPKEGLNPEFHQRLIIKRRSSEKFRCVFVCEVATLLIGYKKLRGIQLLQDTVVTCCDLCNLRRKGGPWRLNIGLFSPHGMGIWPKEPKSGSTLDRFMMSRAPDTTFSFSPFKPTF